MSTATAEPDRQDAGTTPVTMLRGGQSRARQNAGTTQRRKAVSLYEDTQALIWEASELLGMDNDPTVKAALMLLLKEAAKRGIRRKSNDEMIEEIVSGGAS